MSKYLFPILFLLTLAAPFVLRLALGGGGEALASADRRLTVLTPHNPDIKREFADAFDAWHRANYGESVQLDYVNIGGTNDITKALLDLYRSLQNPNGTLPPPAAVDSGTFYDVVWGGGDYTFDQELEKLLGDSDAGEPVGVLQAVDWPGELIAEAFPEPDLAGINLYDNDGDGIHWVGVCLSSFGIVYNPGVYDRLAEHHDRPVPTPETWSDLAKPALADLLVLADPGKSGSAAVAYMMVLQRAMRDAETAHLDAGGEAEGEAYEAAMAEGWKKGTGDLLLIAANADHFTDSATGVPTEVSVGNAAAGMAIDFYGRTEEEVAGSDRVRFVSPPAATAITPDPVAVLHGTTGERLETAERFVEFLLSPAGQRLWITRVGEADGPRQRALRRPPVRRDVYGDRSTWTDDVNPFEEAGGFNQNGAWMREFTETRLIWQAAWIETQEPLKRAYAAVLRVEEPARRAELLAMLRDLPVTWQDVKDLRAARKSPETAEVGEALFMARQRFDWGERFREHYAKIRAAAEGA